MDDKDKLIEELKKENKRLKSQLYYYKNKDNKKTHGYSAWDYYHHSTPYYDSNYEFGDFS